MRGKFLAILMLIALVASACGSDSDTTTETPSDSDSAPADSDDSTDTDDAMEDSVEAVTISYTLWDANQLPGYEACAAAFHEANPAIQVEVEQLGWDDYWTGITTGFVSDTAPDVFTNHLARYPEFAETEVILPLNDLVERDGVETDIYFEGLLDLWKRPDGSLYGLPKDWDTIALTVNNDMLADSGVDPASLADLTWNPQDGGTFEETIAALSVDANGVRGNEPGFDASDVATFGFGLVGASGGGNGQTEWSWLAGANGWTFMDQPFWGTQYNYDDPAFIETIEWIKGAIDKGFIPPFEVFSATGHNDLFKAEQTASTSLGSWEIGDILAAEFDTTFFPTPVGPAGRASMFNGLADSISATTDNPEQAWEWVKYLGSADCQNIIADTAVVFPAIPAAADTVKELRAADGVDVSAFTVHVEEGTTFTFPISDYAADRSAIMDPAMEAIFTGADAASTLADANEDVNKLFG